MFSLVISDLGGLLGLFLGCSLISIVEIVYYTTSGLMGFMSRNKPKSSKKHTNKKPNSVKVIAPMKGFECQGFEMKVSNTDILDALNALTRTVHDNDAKIRRILRDQNQKIMKIEDYMEPNSILDLS